MKMTLSWSLRIQVWQIIKLLNLAEDITWRLFF